MSESTSPKRILVVDAMPEHRDWLVGVAEETGSKVDATESNVDLERDVDPREYELVVINADEFERQQRLKILRMLRRWTTQERTARPLLVSDVSKGYSEVFRELRSYGLMNMVAKNEGEASRRDLIVTMKKIIDNDIFGAQKYLPEDAEVVEHVINTSAAVPELFNEVTEFARGVKLHPRLVDGFGTAVEELVMNALFNAPVDETGKQRYAHMERSAPVTMEPGEEVTVTLVRSPERIGASVADPFGEIGVERCLQRLGKCYRMGDEQVELKDGGAGLGLYFSFGALSHLVVNIAPQKRTEVVGLIDVAGGGYRDFASRAKSFNCFVEA